MTTRKKESTEFQIFHMLSQEDIHKAEIRRRLNESGQSIVSSDTTIDKYLRILERIKWIHSSVRFKGRVRMVIFRITDDGRHRYLQLKLVKSRLHSEVKTETTPKQIQDEVGEWSKTAADSMKRIPLRRDSYASLIDRLGAEDTADDLAGYLIYLWKKARLPRPPTNVLLRRIRRTWARQGILKLDSEGFTKGKGLTRYSQQGYDIGDVLVCDIARGIIDGIIK
jgi:DNA-binding PadR family transcriptional regulator